jgi:hypothetical protein
MGDLPQTQQSSAACAQPKAHAANPRQFFPSCKKSGYEAHREDTGPLRVLKNGYFENVSANYTSSDESGRCSERQPYRVWNDLSSPPRKLVT